MKSEDFKKVLKAVQKHIDNGEPMKAAAEFRHYEPHFTYNQYYKLSAIVSKAVEGG